MSEGMFINKAKSIVVDYFNSHVDMTDSAQIDENDVYIVWFCKTLQNWKALVSTYIPDGKYYEVTYDGCRNRSYLDVYVKLNNYIINDIDQNITEYGNYRG